MSARLNETEIAALIEAAHEAYSHSYVPYSKFPVGAALITTLDEQGDCTIIKGCNVENASFGLAICAERVAITKAISLGLNQFRAIAITAQHTNPCYPCGTCLQFIREFGDDIDILLETENGQFICYGITEMLPHAFTAKDLKTAPEDHSE